MVLELNSRRLAAMFTPIWILLIPSLYLYWDQWMREPLTLAAVGGLPLWAWAVAEFYLKGRWRLEIRRQGLAQHTLTGEQVFEWKRMGPVQVRGRGPKSIFSALVFAYPVDAEAPLEIVSKHLGRSILAIFGDADPKSLASLIEAERQTQIAKK